MRVVVGGVLVVVLLSAAVVVAAHPVIDRWQLAEASPLPVVAPAAAWPMPPAADPAVQALVDSATWARILPKIQKLAAFPTRYSTSPYNAAAAETLKAFFARLGLTVQDHTFTWGSYTLHNIAATQTGTASPDSIFVIGAHYDDMPSTGTAPGADDNASGVAAVMTAAELFAGRPFRYTIKYVCFGGEEQGTNGSEAWAAWARAQNLAIVAMLNFDMIGWWTPGVDFDLEVEVGAAMTWLADVITGAAALYTTMPCHVHVDDGAWWGDHYPFWQQGYHAANHEEAWDWGDPDFNPNYHTSKDTVARLSADYAAGCTKVAVATLATLATLDPLSGVDETPPARPGPTLAAYPNPFNPRVVLAFTLPRAGRARLTVHDLAGRLVAAPVAGDFPAGRHETSWDGRDAAGRGVPAGVYVARLASPDGTVTRRLVLAK